MKQRFRFEKLNVWQTARKLNRCIYKLTRSFPAAERYAMTSQLRRASISVSSNIAEGSGRNSDKDFAHFLEQSYGSLMEIASILYLAFDEGYVNEAALEPVLDQMEELARRIVAFNRSLDVPTTKVNIPKRAGPQALVPRPPSSLD